MTLSPTSLHRNCCRFQHSPVASKIHEGTALPLSLQKVTRELSSTGNAATKHFLRQLQILMPDTPLQCCPGTTFRQLPLQVPLPRVWVFSVGEVVAYFLGYTGYAVHALTTEKVEKWLNLGIQNVISEKN